MRKCKLCKKKLVGRSDKIFCSVACKSKYHRKLNEVTNQATTKIDKILHRNRSILLEILGKKRPKIIVNRIVLENKKFRFQYHTHLHVNKAGKTFFYVYDLAWMSFSSDTILIVRKKS